MLVNVSAIRLEAPSQLPNSVRGWMLGQLLNATVIGRDGQNSIRLDVAGTQVRAATALPLRVGEKLNLEVTQLRPAVTLSPTRPQLSPEKVTLTASVNRLLPQQRALSPILQQLADVLPAAKSNTSANAHDSVARPQLSTPVARAAGNVLSVIPQFSEVIDSKRLPTILHRLGVFAESHALDNTRVRSRHEIPADDLKWQFLRLRGALQTGETPQQNTAHKPKVTSELAQLLLPQKPNPAQTPFNHLAENTIDDVSDIESRQQLLRLVDSAIAKIETNQLKAVTALLDGEVQLSIDLPFMLDDKYQELRLKVLRDGGSGDDYDGESNTIVLEIPISDEASVRAAASLRGDDLNVRLWSSNETLRQMLAGSRETLIERLQANGIENVHVSVVELKPLDEWGRRFDGLVDVTA